MPCSPANESTDRTLSRRKGNVADSKLSDQLYHSFRDDILALELEPGESVSIQKISDRYGGSRTPAREAVMRLQQEGLLIVRPQSGTVISPISVERIRQERFVRTALETAVVDDFVKNCSQLTVDTLKHINSITERAVKREDYMAALQADIRFHRTMFETANDLLALDVSTAHCSHDLRMRYLALAVGGLGSIVVAEHRGIIGAARGRDIDLMRTLTHEHLQHWRRVLPTLRSTCPESYFTD